jgi:hypothetical protein
MTPAMIQNFKNLFSSSMPHHGRKREGFESQKTRWPQTWERRRLAGVPRREDFQINLPLGRRRSQGCQNLALAF